jgi:hypothetical protein
MGKWGNHGAGVSNPLEFDGIRMEAGLYSFALTPKRWMKKPGEATGHGRGLNAQWQKTDRRNMGTKSGIWV